MGATRPFHLLPKEALQLLAFSCERRKLKAGQVLFKAGDPSDGGYFVLSGEIALAAESRERRISRGALIGETALIAEGERRASATAAGEAFVLRIPRETFMRVMQEFPEGAARVHAALSARAMDLVKRLDEVRASAFEA